MGHPQVLATVVACVALLAACSSADADTDAGAPAEVIEAIETIQQLGDEVKADTGDYPRTLDAYFDAGLKVSDDLVLTMTESNEDDEPPCVSVTSNGEVASWQPTDGREMTPGIDCSDR